MPLNCHPRAKAPPDPVGNWARGCTDKHHRWQAPVPLIWHKKDEPVSASPFRRGGWFHHEHPPLCSLTEFWLSSQHLARLRLLHSRCTWWTCFVFFSTPGIHSVALDPIKTSKSAQGEWKDLAAASHTCSYWALLPVGTDRDKEEGELGLSLWTLPSAIRSTSLKFSLNLRNMQDVSSLTVSQKVSGHPRAAPSDDFCGLRRFTKSVFCFNALKREMPIMPFTLATDTMLLLLEISF